MKVLKVNYSRRVPAMMLLLSIPLVGILAYVAAYYGIGVIPFGVLIPYFGFMLYDFMKHWRRIIINYECMVVNSKYQWTVCFRDVEDFYPVTYKGQYLIGIHYKQEHENYRTDEYLDETRETRMGYKLSPGAPYEIPTRYLDIKPQELLKQLNERLHLQKITSRTE